MLSRVAGDPLQWSRDEGEGSGGDFATERTPARKLRVFQFRPFVSHVLIQDRFWF